VIQNRLSRKVHRELLLALESARTRFAVAMAAEAKSTPPDQWQYYMDTADRMRRFAGRLRRSDPNVLAVHEECSHALETLKRLPVEHAAERLCHILGETIGRLESRMLIDKSPRRNQSQNSTDSTDFTIL